MSLGTQHCIRINLLFVCAAAVVPHVAMGAQLLTKGDTYEGIQEQRHEPVSTWDVRLTVLDVKDRDVQLRIDFLRQRMAADGAVVKVGLIHLSKGRLDGQRMQLECLRVNLRSFQGNVGWKIELQVDGERIRGAGFDLKRKVPQGKGKANLLAARDEPAFQWFHNPQDQSALEIENVIATRRPRVVVHLPVHVIVRGSNGRLSIPAPLHRFVDQSCIYSQVTASVAGRKLVGGKHFHAVLVNSEQGQPFFGVELKDVAGDVTIQTDSLVLLPPERDLRQWEQAVSKLHFVKRPRGSGTQEFQFHPPPAHLHKRVEDWVSNSLSDSPQEPLRALIGAVRHVKSYMTYESTVKHEDPYEGLLDDAKGHCGIFATGVDVIGEKLEGRLGLQVFKAGGYWGGPHVRNGVILQTREGKRVFLFADATQPRPLAPQGEHAFVVTSIAGWNSFDEKTANLLPSRQRPPAVPFDVNTFGAANCQIVKYLPVQTRRVTLDSFPLTETTQSRLRRDVRRLEATR